MARKHVFHCRVREVLSSRNAKLGVFGLGKTSTESFFTDSTQFIFLIIRLAPGNVSRSLLICAEKGPLFRHTGIIITRNCGNVNSNANFGMYIQHLQQPWTFLYVHLQIQIMTFFSW